MPTPETKSAAVSNPFAKPTCRVFNEPLKIMGILDAEYAQWCIVPAVICGLFAAATWPARIFVALLAFAVFAWQAQRVADEDRQAPYVWWLTLTDKSHVGAFTQEKGGK